ncbi:hypothetical protein BJ912DRAFT_1004866, partial [Pholiota molesta]
MGTWQRHDAFVVLSLGAITSSSLAAVVPHRGHVIVFGPSNGQAVLERELVKAILCSLWECAPTGIGVVQVARPTSRDARPPSHMRHGGKRRQPDRRSLRRFFQIPDVI